MVHRPGFSNSWHEKVRKASSDEWNYVHKDDENTIINDFDSVDGLYHHIYELDRLEKDGLEPLEPPWIRVTQLWEIGKRTSSREVLKLFEENLGDMPT